MYSTQPTNQILKESHDFREQMFVRWPSLVLDGCHSDREPRDHESQRPHSALSASH